MSSEHDETILKIGDVCGKAFVAAIKDYGASDARAHDAKRDKQTRGGQGGSLHHSSSSALAT